MAGIEINKLTNCNVYLDGTSHVGKAEEIEMPEVVAKMADHKALGLIGDLEFWTGGIEKMSAKIKWNAFYKDVYKKMAHPGKALKFMVRGALQTHSSNGLESTVPYVVYMTAFSKRLPTGSFKALDNSEFPSEFNVNYVKVEVNGAEVLEVDVLANIYKVDGVDILADYRAALGL